MPLLLIVMLFSNFFYFWLMPPNYPEGSSDQKLERTNPGTLLTRGEMLYATVLRTSFSLFVTWLLYRYLPELGEFYHLGFFIAVFWFSNRLAKVCMIKRARTLAARDIDRYFQQRTVQQVGVTGTFLSFLLPLFCLHFGFSVWGLQHVQQGGYTAGKQGFSLVLIWLINQITYQRITHPWFLRIYKLNQATSTAYLAGRAKERAQRSIYEDLHDPYA